jgi:flagellar biosynthesis/type III secretory pathway protein FliH
MTNNKQKTNPENPNNQFSNSEPMTFTQKVEYVKSIDMTNNKQQTEINAVEYIDKVNQFAKENNTDKPRQQTAVEWLLNAIETKNGEEFSSYYTEFIEQAKEMEIAGKEISYADGYKEGYKRALDYISMSIENAKALISAEII